MVELLPCSHRHRALLEDLALGPRWTCKGGIGPSEHSLRAEPFSLPFFPWGPSRQGPSA